MPARPAFAALLALQGLAAALGAGDAAALVQQSVLKHSGPAPKHSEPSHKRLVPLEPKKPTLTRREVILDLEGEGMGFDVKIEDSHGEYKYREPLLLVDSVASKGQVARWNFEHPLTPLLPGDRIVQVNGARGDAVRLRNTLMPLAQTTARIRMLVEPAGLPVGESAKLFMEGVHRIKEKGAKEFIREVLPFDMGKVFINAANDADVKECKHISSPLYCSDSQEKYGISCAGWAGQECLAHGDATCEKLRVEGACNSATEKFNITCVGWGGSYCLPQGADPSMITDAEVCKHAEETLGIEVSGWGGNSCLARDAKCSEITLSGLCNNAEEKLGLSCLGWGGSSCLDHGSGPELITSESLCKKSVELFGLETIGWSGSHCLAKSEVSCDGITDAGICHRAKDRFGLECAGWGGSSCLDVGASPTSITSASICQRSAQALGIPSGGWSGSGCLPPGPVKCASITHQGVCNDAANRLGIDCAGWSGSECLAAGEVKCNRITTQAVCARALAKLGKECMWQEDKCVPDTLVSW